MPGSKPHRDLPEAPSRYGHKCKCTVSIDRRADDVAPDLGDATQDQGSVFMNAVDPSSSEPPPSDQEPSDAWSSAALASATSPVFLPAMLLIRPGSIESSETTGPDQSGLDSTDVGTTDEVHLL